MSPYKIEMFVSGYTKDKEPLYKVRIYDRDGELMANTNDISKERAIKAIADYCCVTL